MSVQTNLEESEVVEAFKNEFKFVDRADTDSLYEDEVDGKCWISNAKVLLLTPEVSKYGVVEFDGYEDAEYERTHTIEGSNDNFRCYGFSAGNDTHWVQCKLVRKLANDVFDVSYSEIRSWAKTHRGELGDTPYDVENDRPVLFDVPDSPFRVVISPVVHSCDENDCE